ncbi:ATP-dependent acyl-CoA ligase [Amycolatopsis rhizosphaerae]|uniref:ATP-dependent acyl-CoA ligase n=1 Tax=Amycolatopsis rhizosphaerae TaxID=2053003 RepID=A0A558DIU8_9PSEU|nr:AMP-binding protein [Amycolatopsis rhizosphaerae]TVT60925.1 ATP-dependent acyl-CoA ligase [Amycolatopsis rhizosphaerae]
MKGVLTLPEFLAEGAARWPDRPWCSAPDGDATRAQMYTDALACATSLRAAGVGRGDRVVIVLPNGLDFLRVWLGTILAGAVAVAVNPKASESELPAVVAATDPAIVVTAPDAAVPGGVDAATVTGLVATGKREGVPATPDTHAGYIQSSGSTGRPKFIIQTHGMYTMAGEGFPHWLGLTEDDVLLTTLPLAHLNAQAYSALGSWGCGARLVLPPRFSAGAFWQTARESGATVVNMIGAMLEMLMRQDPTPADHEHSIRLCYSAPAPDAARHAQIEKRFGLRLVIGYAQSESPYGLINPVDEPPVYGSMGRPRQHPRLGRINEARVVDPVRGTELGDGEVGELQLRNPAITPGYAGMAEESAALKNAEGWLHTGDLVRRDGHGRFTFAGRLKEMIRRRGENLSPAEVEAVLDAHPAVSSSAVVGVPSALSEEDVKAFVHAAEGHTVTAAELAEWCAHRLPPYKQPRYIEFVDSWPLTETHKIAKTRLPRDRNDIEVDLVEHAR